MQRCSFFLAPARPRHAHCSDHHAPPRLLALLLAIAGLWASVPAAAQAPVQMPAPGAMRNFPEAALRGTLRISDDGQAILNGNAIQTAPGLRIFSPQNALLMRHSLVGQSFTVNYLIERSTGWLITAWILSKAEIAQPRQGSTEVERNYRFESDAGMR